MRRKDREVTDVDSVTDFLDKEQIMRIGFYDKGEIYIVPVNYGYTLQDNELTFFFHGAKAGRKYELSLNSPEAGFEIDGNYKVLEAESACSFSAMYKSVIGTGTVKIIDDTDEKKSALACIMKQITGKEHTFDEKEVNNTAVYKLKVTKLSCKERK